jgi:hypothetical protein
MSHGERAMEKLVQVTQSQPNGDLSVRQFELASLEA